MTGVGGALGLSVGSLNGRAAWAGDAARQNAPTSASSARSALSGRRGRKRCMAASSEAAAPGVVVVSLALGARGGRHERRERLDLRVVEALRVVGRHELLG